MIFKKNGPVSSKELWAKFTKLASSIYAFARLVIDVAILFTER